MAECSFPVSGEVVTSEGCLESRDTQFKQTSEPRANGQTNQPANHSGKIKSNQLMRHSNESAH